MNEDFDFKKVGKRMPYQVPDGFFDQMEERVMSQIQQEAKEEVKPTKGRIFRMAFGTLAAAAAAIALFFVVHKAVPEPMTSDESFSLVELAYHNLSSEDQEYLLQIYEEDLFYNDNNYEEE